MTVVVCLSLSGLPPASAAGRVLEQRYEQPAAGSSDTGGGCAAGADGCESFPSGPGEVLMGVEITDDAGGLVSASVRWDTDGDGISDTGFKVCGKTEKPQEIPPNTEIRIFVWSAPSSTCPNAMATAGVVKATFLTGASGGDGGTTALASPKAQLGFSDTTPKRDSTITAKTGIRVCGKHAGTTIQLHRKKSGVFRKIASKKLDSNCRATFKVVANFKSATFKSVWPKQDSDHRAGKSRPVTVTTH